MLPVNHLQIALQFSCEDRSLNDSLLPLELVFSGTLRSITFGGIKLFAENEHDYLHSSDLDKREFQASGTVSLSDEIVGNLARLEVELLNESPARIESSLRSAEQKIRDLPTPLRENGLKMVNTVHNECMKRREILSEIEKQVKEAYLEGNEEKVEDAWVQLVTAMEKWPPALKQLGRDAYEEACKLGYDERLQRHLQTAFPPQNDSNLYTHISFYHLPPFTLSRRHPGRSSLECRHERSD